MLKCSYRVVFLGVSIVARPTNIKFLEKNTVLATSPGLRTDSACVSCRVFQSAARLAVVIHTTLHTQDRGLEPLESSL